ncbi:hypothetical protein E2C01_038858 [Portunus trituberculatus]|uniref:Uncharacterized protein n=1 Tax=Portunus trituberculatus TaxID=210409 RepID=A0A5B7FJM7_PORTR|nr:hypothetical protein [Portunus trituberculatus]
MEMSKSKRRPTWKYKMEKEIIMKKNEEKNLGKTLTNFMYKSIDDEKGHNHYDKT